MPLDSPDPLAEAIVFWTLGGALFVLGSAIILIAFRGYRRNQSKPMLFLAIGFTAIILPEFGIVLVSMFVELPEFWAITALQVTNVVAFACILYAITMDA